MSFSTLLNGADCGPMNPLQGAMKGVNSDWSLQRDRFVQAGPSNSGASSSQQHQHQLQQQQEAEQFYAAAAADARHRAFDLGAMRQQLPKAGHPSFSHAAPQNAPHSQWSEEFANTTRASASPTPTAARSQQQQPSRSSTPFISAPQQQRMPFRSMMQHPQLHSAGPYSDRQSDLKGKSKASEAAESNEAWDQAFAQFTPAPAQASTSSSTDQQQEHQEGEEDLLKDLNAQWQAMHNQVSDHHQADRDLAQWEAQHGAQISSTMNGEDEDYMSAGLKPYSLEDLQQNPPEWEWLTEERNFQEYEDPYAEGLRLLHSGAPFIQVEHAFEEACRRDSQRVEAWTALGEALASDEKEALAIRALEKAVSITQAPAVDGGQNVESAWISLAISYINEAQDSRALLVLEQWIHKMYPGLQHASPLASMASQSAYENPWANHQKIVNLFIDAARAGPSARARNTKGPAVTDAIDADVQLGLGVLLYSNSDYDLAKDCFEAALSVKPDDYVLWNRLGATMANGGHPEDAIHAYRRALELRPHFTRSLYNLAVSCMNIGCYKEAAEHLLTALDMQGNSGKGSESDGLWHTLRRAMLCLDRQDLATLALPGADTSAFRSKGFDF